MTNQQKKAENKQQLSGSGEYIASRKFDHITKSLQKEIKELELSKAFIILSHADKFEKAGYELNKICHRITQDLSGPKYNTSASYVRKVLPPKYKDVEQREVALLQNNSKSHAGATRYRQQEQVAQKDIKEVTIDDVKFLSPKRLQKVAIQAMQKADYWEYQAKQQQQQQQGEGREKEKQPSKEKQQTSIEGPKDYELYVPIVDVWTTFVGKKLTTKVKQQIGDSKLAITITVDQKEHKVSPKSLRLIEPSSSS